MAYGKNDSHLFDKLNKWELTNLYLSLINNSKRYFFKIKLSLPQNFMQ